MRDPSGHFELSLLSQEDGKPLLEVTSGHDGRVYAVAETGEDFTVTIHRSSRDYPVRMTKDYGTTDTIMARLAVDGKDVGYYCVLKNPGEKATFQGFLKTGDATRVVYQAFVLAAPVTVAGQQAAAQQQGASGSGASASSLNLGSLVLSLFECRDVGVYAGSTIYGPGTSDAAPAPARDDKKFFMKPSLRTEAGAPFETRGFSGRTYAQVGECFARMELHVETPSTLLLRQVLRPDSAAALLDRYPETRGALPQAGGAGPSTTTAFVDLVKVEPCANDEVLAAKRRREVLVCDLTAGDDDEAGDDGGAGGSSAAAQRAQRPRWTTQPQEEKDLS